MIIDLKMCMSRSFHSKKSYLCIIGMIAALYIWAGSNHTTERERII